MDDFEQLLDQAERLYRADENFREARDLLRSTLAETEPTARAMLLLYISTRADEREQWMSMLLKYRDSIAVKKGVAEALVGQDAWTVVDICREILGMTPLTRRDELDTRWTRIRAVAQLTVHEEPKRYATLVEDFKALWSAEEAKTGLWLPFERRRLLSIVTHIESPEAIPSLEELTSEERLPASVRRLLELKIAELTALEEARQELSAK